MPDMKDNNPTVKTLTIRNLQLWSTQRLNQKVVFQILLGWDEKKKQQFTRKEENLWSLAIQLHFRDVESIKFMEKLYGILEDYLGVCFLMITLVMTLNHYRYIDAIISQDCLINTAEILFMLSDAVQAAFW